MAHKTLIGGTAYEVSGGKCNVNGTAYSIKSGKTKIGGTGYDINFSNEILASELSVGSTVKLMENGKLVEYLVVNNGKPSGSSLYDDSCDGTWLLRKDLYVSRQWHSSNVNNYASSTIHTYLNGTFLGLLGSIERSAIKQVKIPYGKSDGSVLSGTSGLSTKIFLLSSFEAGWTSGQVTETPIEGACLSYFSGTAGADTKRIAYLNGTATSWWLRTPWVRSTQYVWRTIAGTGNCTPNEASKSFGIRPALILSKNALFDKKTMQLLGVA